MLYADAVVSAARGPVQPCQPACRLIRYFSVSAAYSTGLQDVTCHAVPPTCHCYRLAPSRAFSCFSVFTSPAVKLRSIVISVYVCLSVCLSARICQKPHVQISPNFLYMLPVATAWSCSDGSIISCVLPALWMTSSFHIIERIGQNQRRRVTRMLRPVRLLVALGAMSHHVCRTSPTVRLLLFRQCIHKQYKYM